MLFGLAACGKGGKNAQTADAGETTSDAGAVQAQQSVPGWKSSFMTLQADSMWGLRPVIYTDDGLYATASVVLGRREIPAGQVEEYEGQYDIYGSVICFIDNSGKVTVLPNYVPELPEADNGRKDFYSYCTLGYPVLNSDGNLAVLQTCESGWYSGPDAVYGNTAYYQDNYYYHQVRTEYRILSTDGTELSRAEVRIEPMDAYLNISSVAAGPDGSILAAMDASLLCIGKDGTVLWSADTANYLTGVVTLADGRVAVTTYENEEPVLRILDLDTHKLGESRAIPDSVWSPIPGNGKYDLFYSGGLALYGLRIGETPEPILNWLDCDINGQTLDTGTLSVSEDGTVRGLVSDYVGENEVSQLFTIRWTGDGGTPQKNVITFAQLDFYPDYSIVNRVLHYNRTHDDVRIAFTDYSLYNGDDTSGSRAKLTEDLLAGNAPDIVPVGDLPYRFLAARGLLADLYPLLDADSELKRSDFFPNVLAALECDGGLYQAVSGFTVNTLSGPKDLVGSAQGWTYDDFFAALNQMPAGSSILEQYMVQSDVLTVLLSLNYDRFVDWEKGEADFESDEFKQLLSFVNCFPRDVDWDSIGDDSEVLSTADRIRMRSQMLLQSFLYSPDALIWSDVDLGSDEMTYVGWPVGEGIGSMLRMDSGYAISSSCRNRDAAWAFLRTLLTAEGQQNTGSLPTNRGAYDAQVQSLMTEDYERDANGEPILDAAGQPLRKAIVTWYDDDSVPHYVYSMTQDQADRALSVIENCTRMAGFDDAVFNIVYEESEYYFSGVRSVDDVARLIQSRVSSYMSEQLFEG